MYKPNAMTGMIAAFVLLVGVAAALLLMRGDDTAKVLGPAGGQFAAAGTPAIKSTPPKPRDERFVIKRILPISGPIKYGEWHWNDKGVADGPVVITVDLEARVLSVFKGGYEIGATAVLLGTSEKPTPLGVFPVIWKKKNHYSSIYDSAPMPFTQRLTNDGISIHGTLVEKGYASHGCIGVPEQFASKLYGVTKLGDQVYITRGKTIGKGDSLVEG
jgi:L,D-transpeptidase catalytic domain